MNSIGACLMFFPCALLLCYHKATVVFTALNNDSFSFEIAVISFVVKMCATQLFSPNQISAVCIVQLKIKFSLFCVTVLNPGKCI